MLVGRALTPYFAVGRLADLDLMHSIDGDEPVVLMLQSLGPEVLLLVESRPEIVALVAQVGSVTSHGAVLLREFSSRGTRQIAAVAGIDLEDAGAWLGLRVGVAEGCLHLEGTVATPRGPDTSAGYSAREEKVRPLICARPEGTWMCYRPTYHYTELDQSLITSGWSAAGSTLFGCDALEVEYDDTGLQWVCGYPLSTDVVKRIWEAPEWFSERVDAQHAALFPGFTRFAEFYPQLEEPKAPPIATLLEVWRAVEHTYFDLCRFLPLSSLTYPLLFAQYIERLVASGRSQLEANGQLADLAYSSYAASAVEGGIYPSLVKTLDAAFVAPGSPPRIKPPLTPPSTRCHRSGHNADAYVVRLMFEAKEEKFYAHAVAQGWACQALRWTHSALDVDPRSLLAQPVASLRDILQNAGR